MSASIIFIIIIIAMIVLCIVSKCFENSYMARVRRTPDQLDSNTLDFDIPST